MNLRTITYAQAIVLVACIAGTFAAYKFLGPEAAGASSVVSMILNFLMGRPSNPPPPDADGKPYLKVIDGGADKGGQS